MNETSAPPLAPGRLTGRVGAVAAIVALLAGCVPGPVVYPSPGDRPVTSPRPPVVQPRPRDGDRPVSSPTRPPVIIAPAPGMPPGPGTGPVLPPGPPDVATGIAGRVVDRRGRPVEGVFVQVAGIGSGTPPVPDMAVFTDRDGRFRWYLAPGDYRVTVSAPGRAAASRQVRVTAGGAVAADFVLD